MESSRNGGYLGPISASPLTHLNLDKLELPELVSSLLRARENSFWFGAGAGNSEKTSLSQQHAG